MAKMRDLDPESIYDPSGCVTEASIAKHIASIAKQDAGLANDLEWTYANIAWQYRKPPDPRPLAALLRSGKPIPRGIREDLAELLDSGKLILSDITLKPVRKRGVTPRKLEFFVKSLRAVIMSSFARLENPRTSRAPRSPRYINGNVTRVFSIVTGTWCLNIWHACREVTAKKSSQARILANNRS